MDICLMIYNNKNDEIHGFVLNETWEMQEIVNIFPYLAFFVKNIPNLI